MYQEQCCLEKTIVALKADKKHLEEKVEVCFTFYARQQVLL